MSKRKVPRQVLTDCSETRIIGRETLVFETAISLSLRIFHYLYILRTSYFIGLHLSIFVYAFVFMWTSFQTCVCAGAFLVPYTMLAVLCGLPLFLMESAIGQYTQEGAVTCWRKLCPLAQGKTKVWVHLNNKLIR
jgi:hypothetical protein